MNERSIPAQARASRLDRRVVDTVRTRGNAALSKAPIARPTTWHKAAAVGLISYDNDSVWTLDVRLDSGERMGIELSKLSVLELSGAIAEWKEWAKSSPTGRRDFSSRTTKR